MLMTTRWMIGKSRLAIGFIAGGRRTGAASKRRRHRSALERLETRALLSGAPPTYTVTSLSDSGPGSLRAAIASAESAPNTAPITIGFAPSLAGKTIELTSFTDDPYAGPSALVISGANTITIDGSAAPGLTIARASSAPAFRVIDASGGRFTLTNITVSGGFANSASGAPAGDGGGVFVRTNATLTNDVFTDNSASDDGGAVYYDSLSSGSLSGDVFSSNTANNGGGLAAHDASGEPTSSEFTVLNCAFTGNTATTSGGGVYGETGMLIANSTLNGNSAGSGGGAAIDFPESILANDTFYGNAATSGGGLTIGEEELLVNDTFTSNTASAPNGGGGIHAGQYLVPTNLFNCIVVGNYAKASGGQAQPNDIAGAAGDLNGQSNLIGDPASAAGLQNGVDGNIVGNGSGGTISPAAVFVTTSVSGSAVPLLAQNGGLVETVALAPGSPAIGHGNGTLALSNGVTTDARGVLRPLTGPVDIGAYQTPSTLPIEGPRVTAVRRLGIHAQPTELILNFNQPLAVGPAQDLANYTLRLFGTRFSVRLAFASYNGATDQVGLATRRPLPLRHAYVLTINGTSPRGLTNADGVFLAGQGQPGTSEKIIITRKNLVMAEHPAARHR